MSLLICGQLMRHPLIELFHLSNLLHMPNDCRMVDIELLAKSHAEDQLQWLLSIGHCLVVSDPLQLSESWQNHYLWEVCSANWWDAPKTAMTAASIDQQKGPNSSPWQRQTACCTTNTAKVEPIGLQSFASSVIFTWPFANCLPLLQASRQLFAGKILPQPAGCGKCFHHQKDELSKSSLNPKAWIFMLQE